MYLLKKILLIKLLIFKLKKIFKIILEILLFYINNCIFNIF